MNVNQPSVVLLVSRLAVKDVQQHQQSEHPRQQLVGPPGGRMQYCRLTSPLFASVVFVLRRCGRCPGCLFSDLKAGGASIHPRTPEEHRATLIGSRVPLAFSAGSARRVQRLLSWRIVSFFLLATRCVDGGESSCRLCLENMWPVKKKTSPVFRAVTLARNSQSEFILPFHKPNDSPLFCN